MDSPLQVLVTYAHDPMGRKLAQGLVSSLRTAGIEAAVWDGDMPEDNPVSTAEWMTRKIEESVVISVLSPDYVRRFGRGSTSRHRKGVLYEGRLIMSKIYHHTEANNCPVIPVALPDFPAELAPNVLLNLVIARFDPDTGAGVTQILARLARLGVAVQVPVAPEEGEVQMIDPVDPVPSGARPPSTGMCELEGVDPTSSAALKMVNGWLLIGKASLGVSTDFTAAVPAVERIIKSAGAVDVGGEVADLCVEALSGTNLLQWEKNMLARVLITVKAWQWRRQGRFVEALDVVARGIALARECGDDNLVAIGESVYGRVHRGLAEQTEGRARVQHLELAECYARKAIKKFKALERLDEVGVCNIVLARVHLARFLLLAERVGLSRADKYATRATRLLSSDKVREYQELRILRAEIHTAKWYRRSQAQALLDGAIMALAARADDGASYAELLARGHLARAKLHRKRRGRDVTKDVEAALEIFESLGLERLVQECRWFQAKAGPSGLSGRDVRILERLSADPAVLLLAAEERQRRVAEGTVGRWTKPSVWKAIVTGVRERR